MPPLPGEEVLATVYTDIHYYFTQPTTRPLLHRFDKASYFYIYHNSTRRTTRLEIANNPGSPEQDAFSGYLDRTRILNTYKFPTQVTLIVDALDAPAAQSPTTTSHRASEWRLASADPRDSGKNMYRLHTLDLYFWALEDAQTVISLFRRFLQPSQLDIEELDEPEVTEEDAHNRHHDDVSPVVQALENVAISDPAYRNGQTRNSQNQAQTQPTQLPPPPPPPQSTQPATSPSPVSDMSHPAGRSPEPPASYAPMAYNPAAPPAPEPIAHREDTPPPVDGTTGTGLTAAAIHDQTFTPGMPQSPPYTGAPLSGQATNAYGHYGSPSPANPASYGSPPAGSQKSPSLSFGPPPTNPSALGPPTGHENRHPSIAEQNYVPHPTDSKTPVQTPGTQFYNQIPQSHQPLTHVQPQYADYLSARPQPPPIGGYSQFSYDQAQAQQQRPPTNPYDVHSQVYRPTEEEHRKNSGHRPSQSGSGGKGSRFDQGAERVERGVGRLFKKLEKKIG